MITMILKTLLGKAETRLFNFHFFQLKISI